MFQPGEILEERYIIASILGRGGAATVYLAEDMTTRTPVALKTSRTKLLLRESSSISHERTIYEKLCSVSAIPQMRGFFTHELRHVMVLPFLGKSMKQMYLSGGALSVPEACRMGLAILEALQAMHEKKIVHLDIKPENVLYDGAYHVTDLGSARTIDGRRGRYVGTPAFSSLNVDNGGAPGRADDLESMVYTMCAVTGGLKWLNEEWKIVDGDWRGIKEGCRESLVEEFPEAFRKAWKLIREGRVRYEHIRKLLRLSIAQASLSNSRK